MFGFITRLFRRTETGVFRFYDGYRYRSVDPVAVEHMLTEVLGEDWLDKVISLKTSLPPDMIGEEATKAKHDKMELQREILKAIDVAFGVKPFENGRGLTAAKRFGLLEGYNRFCLDLIRNARPFVNSQSRASPGPVPSPPASGPESISTVT